MASNKICPPLDRSYNCMTFDDPDSYAAQCKRKTDNVLRGRVEALMAKRLVFITLTYDDEHLPTTYQQVKDIKLFRQRETRRKVPVWPSRQLPNGESRGYKWITKNSRPLNLKNNVYRKKEIFDEADFKACKHKYMAETGYKGKDSHLGLLVPSHLSNFLKALRDDMRNSFGGKFHLRFISNGEYGEHLNRPHYHVVVFDSQPSYDYQEFVKNNWQNGIVSVDYLSTTSVDTTRKVTAYITGHTVKKDNGTRYQDELSPCFSIQSNYNGGIGWQLSDVSTIDSVSEDVKKTSEFMFLRSLSISLAEWKPSIQPLTYQVIDDKGNLYEYNIARYYRKLKLGKCYKSSTRHFFTSICSSAQKLCLTFLKFHGFTGRFDLLPTFYMLGVFKGPQDLLEFFVQSVPALRKKLLTYENIRGLVRQYLHILRDNDTMKREIYKRKYVQRKQEKKYQAYLKKKGYTNLT